MARSFVLEDHSVRVAAGRCFVTLEAWDPEALEAFAKIVIHAFPQSKFRRTTARPETFLGLQVALRLVGDRPSDGSARVEALLGLVSRSLTIEDTLDESHALGYHQDQDEATGSLKRSALGRLVNEAKYRRSRAPRERIGEAVTDFIKAHPRYARAGAIASTPSHEEGRASGLSGRLVRQVSEALKLRHIGIRRAYTKPPQKEITDEDRRLGVRKRLANQKNSMVADDDVSGLTVIVVDDLYGSGGTMQEAGRALRAAGAEQVLGLCITKQRLFEGVSLSQGI